MSPRSSYALSLGSTLFSSSLCRIDFYKNMLAEMQGQSQTVHLHMRNQGKTYCTICEAPASISSNLLALMVQISNQRISTLSGVCWLAPVSVCPRMFWVGQFFVQEYLDVVCCSASLSSGNKYPQDSLLQTALCTACCLQWVSENATQNEELLV